MAVSPEARKFLAYWGAISGAAGTKASTTRIWKAIRKRQLELGPHAPLPFLTAVNELRHLATTAREARIAFDRARNIVERTGIAQTIPDRAYTLTPWSRPQAEIDELKAYRVRYLTTRLGLNGERVEQWLMAEFGPINMPRTIGGLLQKLSEEHMENGERYVQGIDQILSVEINLV